MKMKMRKPNILVYECATNRRAFIMMRTQVRSKTRRTRPLTSASSTHAVHQPTLVTEVATDQL